MIAYTNLITVRDEYHLNLTNNYLPLHINLGQIGTILKLMKRRLKNKMGSHLFFSSNKIHGDKNKLNVKLTYKIFGPPTSINIDETAVRHRWFFSSFHPSVRSFPGRIVTIDRILYLNFSPAGKMSFRLCEESAKFTSQTAGKYRRKHPSLSWGIIIAHSI